MFLDGNSTYLWERGSFGRGVGYLQTHQPEHPVMKALIACDREAFYGSEIDARERTGYPPFGRLASLIISAGDRPTAEGFARKLAAIAPIDERIQVLGPAEAPLAVIKGASTKADAKLSLAGPEAVERILRTMLPTPDVYPSTEMR